MGNKKINKHYQYLTDEQLRQLGTFAKIAREDFINNFYFTNKQLKLVKKYREFM